MNPIPTFTFMRLNTSIALGVTAALFCLAFFQNPASAEKVLTGEVCTEKVHRLTSEINWYKSLTKAEEDAEREGKLVFWIHMLGKIDGAT